MTAPALDPRGGEGHNHVTRDIKPVGKCPACDEYWGTNWGNPRPPAAGRGDTDDNGECQRSDWCGPGSHCLCVPAARPAEPPGELREALAEALRKAAHVCGWDVPCPCVDWPDEQYDAAVHATTVSAGHVNEVQGIPEAFADALLPVLAPLLADRATVKRVEALCTAAVAAAMTPNTSVTVADLRRALGGPQ